MLVAGFVTVISVLLIIAAIGLNSISILSDKLAQTVNDNNVRSLHGYKMHNSSRERTAILHKMATTEDVFDRDELFIQLRQQGEKFLKARQNIIDLGVDSESQKLLDRQREYSSIAGPLQYKVIDLLNENRVDAAMSLLITQVIPVQDSAMQAINQFIGLQQQRNSHSLELTSKEFSQSIKLIIVLTIFGITIATLVSGVIFRRTNFVFQALYNSELREKVIRENIVDVVITYNKQGVIESCNKAVKEVFGYDSLDVIGEKITGLICVEDKAYSDDELSVSQLSNHINLTRQVTAHHKNGKEITLHVGVSKVTINNQLLYVAVLTDITEEIKTEGLLRELNEELETRVIERTRELQYAVQELRQSELKHRRMIENLGAEYFFYSHDKEGVFNYVSPSITNILGYSQKEFCVDFDAFLTDNPVNEKVIEYTRNSIQGKQQPAYDLEIFNKNGEIHQLQVVESPVFDEQGKVIAVEGLAHDVTEYRQKEVMLRRTQKMDALGQLSGGIAHDFNNQLGVIIGYLDMLGNRFESENMASRWIKTASRATMRCMELTRQLLMFSRNQAMEKTEVNINNSIVEMEAVIARSVTPEVDVQYHLDEQVWPSLLNEGELQDAILNLVINARDAMPTGGVLQIETRNVELDEGQVLTMQGIESGDFIELVISDNGSGMSRQIQEQLFEPFYTTKTDGKGTGLGMAMVYGFVKRYGGQVRVYSEPNVGTTMRLYFPRYEKVPGRINFKNNAENEPLVLPGGSETILIVDDEVDLLELADNYLQDLGYQTVTAKNATEALEIFKQNSAIDFIFSDVVMPGDMNGYDLVKKLLN